MRGFFLSTAFIAVAAFGAAAEEAARPAITSTIQKQFDAFLSDDVDTAFTFASPNIKGMFGSPDRFGQMVREAYPMVWRPSDIRFLELRDVAGSLWQRVMVTDQAGRTHVLDYQMIESADGWQINGVQLLPDVGVGA